MEVADGVFLVPIPIPGPLRTVNAYLCRGETGWTVVDTGFHTPEAEEAWRRAFADRGIGPADVERIVVTHFHPDHFGAAGWLQELSGAPVLMLDRELPQVENVWGRPAEAARNEASLYARHGMPAPVLDELAQYHARHFRRVQPVARVTPVSEGDPVPVGDRTFRAMWLPGHSPGLMVLWDEADRLLLVNDMVLMRITPNVPQWSERGGSPLRSFLESLDRVGRLPARVSLPGHREPISDLGGRAQEIRTHHHRRLADVLALVRDGRGAATAWEVSLGLFGPQDAIHNTRFALAETLAHLEYLVEEGLLGKEEADGRVRYRSRE